MPASVASTVPVPAVHNLEDMLLQMQTHSQALPCVVKGSASTAAAMAFAAANAADTAATAAAAGADALQAIETAMWACYCGYWSRAEAELALRKDFDLTGETGVCLIRRKVGGGVGSLVLSYLVDENEARREQEIKKRFSKILAWGVGVGILW